MCEMPDADEGHTVDGVALVAIDCGAEAVVLSCLKTVVRE